MLGNTEGDNQNLRGALIKLERKFIPFILMLGLSCNKLCIGFSFNRLIQSKISIWLLSIRIKITLLLSGKDLDPTIPDEDASAGNLLHVYGIGLPKRIRLEEYYCC